MRGLLAFSCRSFPGDHRARRSDEVVDTALLVADGSGLRTVREALSLVVAGVWQRLRAESQRSLREGVGLLAGALALVNLAVALAGILFGFRAYVGPSLYIWKLWYGPGSYPYVIDPWWIAFAVAAAAIVFGLARGHRGLAVGAAIANLALVACDARGVYNTDAGPHFNVFILWWPSSYPTAGKWLVPAIVLAVATLAARPRRLPLPRLALSLAGAGLLAWLALPSQRAGGAFFFLRWPLAAIILLGVAFGAIAPRLAVLACGLTLAALPGVIPYYLTGLHTHPHSEYSTIPQTGSLDPIVLVVVVAGLALGPILLAQLARRQLDLTSVARGLSVVAANSRAMPSSVPALAALTMARSEAEAEVLCGMLRTNGIACAHQQTNVGAAAVVGSARGGPLEIFVSAEDMRRARKLLVPEQIDG